MDKYKIRIKNRMMFEMIGTVVLLPVAVYALIRYWNIEGVLSGTPIKDFFGGVINGVRGAVVIAFVIYLMISFVKNMLAIRNEEKLKKMYFEEYDERALAISEHSSRVTYNITIYIILVGCIITIKSKIVCKFLSYYRPEHCHLDYPARRSPVKGKGYASASRTLDWMPDFAGDSC